MAELFAASVPFYNADLILGILPKFCSEKL